LNCFTTTEELDRRPQQRSWSGADGRGGRATPVCTSSTTDTPPSSGRHRSSLRQQGSGLGEVGARRRPAFFSLHAPLPLSTSQRAGEGAMAGRGGRTLPCTGWSIPVPSPRWRTPGSPPHHATTGSPPEHKKPRFEARFVRPYSSTMD
jgi:hypothetical protein